MKRTVTIFDSITASKKVLENVEANTLSDIKNLMDDNDIPYNDRDFIEAVSHTQLIDDNSVLPSNVPYKGKTTNDLLIYMTYNNMRVKSGARTRKELYQIIAHNDLKDEIKETFGKNYTHVTTADLDKYITDVVSSTSEPEDWKVEPEAQEERAGTGHAHDSSLYDILEQMNRNVDRLIQMSESMLEILKGRKEEDKVEPGFSDDEIRELTENL